MIPNSHQRPATQRPECVISRVYSHGCLEESSGSHVPSTPLPASISLRFPHIPSASTNSLAQSGSTNVSSLPTDSPSIPLITPLPQSTEKPSSTLVIPTTIYTSSTSVLSLVTDAPGNASTASPSSSFVASTNSSVLVAEPSASATSVAEFIGHRSNKAGAIAGGVVGGTALLILLLLSLMCRKRLAARIMRLQNRHVAPSAEFLGPTSRSKLEHAGLGAGTTSPAPFISHQRTISPLLMGDIFKDIAVEEPPPFTAGTFSDPVMEKVNSATRQRELYFQTQSRAIDGRGARSPHDRLSPHRGPMLDNPFSPDKIYPVDTADYPVTSPILGGGDHELQAAATIDSHSNIGSMAGKPRT